MYPTMALPYPQRRGLMLVLSSPSGAGKTTIAKALLSLDTQLKLSVSVTTRPKRPSEIEGKDYFFVAKNTFHYLVENQLLLEHATVFDYHYGTPKSFIENALTEGTDVLFDIDWQGTQQLKQVASSDVVNIFILPPSVQDLNQRLKDRAQDSHEVVLKRMSKATDEMSHWAEYDYVIINDNLEESIQQIYSILKAERLKRSRQPGLGEFVNFLRDSAS